MRYTEKMSSGVYDFINTNYAFSVSQGANKLGQLEDIEEKHNIESVEDLDKKLTILEIIIERRCSVSDFILDSPTWEEVLRDYDYWFCELPTKEEYELLKEVLL